jgi:predicted ArsR family transcriptional regulator
MYDHLILPQGKGRRINHNSVQYKTREAVLSFMAVGDRTATTVEIANSVDFDIDEVRRALKFFTNNGIMLCCGVSKVKGGQGQPPKLWKRIK